MENYDRFFTLLERYPRISGLWNRKTRQMDIKRFKRELKVMSDGERHLAKFFAAVWLNENTYGFDLVNAIHSLAPADRAMISGWVNHPFYP